MAARSVVARVKQRARALIREQASAQGRPLADLFVQQGFRLIRLSQRTCLQDWRCLDCDAIVSVSYEPSTPVGTWGDGPKRAHDCPRKLALRASG